MGGKGGAAKYTAKGSNWNYQKKEYKNRSKHRSTTPWMVANSAFTGNSRGLWIWWFMKNVKTALGVGGKVPQLCQTPLPDSQFVVNNVLWLIKICLFLVETEVATGPIAASYISLIASCHTLSNQGDHAKLMCISTTHRFETLLEKQVKHLKATNHLLKFCSIF